MIFVDFVIGDGDRKSHCEGEDVVSFAVEASSDSSGSVFFANGME